jgi:hypothetical protein
MMKKPVQETDPADESNADAPASEEGYAITILVTAKGFSVQKGDLPAEPSEPTDEAPAEESDEAPLETSTDMLKAVLKIVKENPIGDDAAKQMAAGYNS